MRFIRNAQRLSGHCINIFKRGKKWHVVRMVGTPLPVCVCVCGCECICVALPVAAMTTFNFTSCIRWSHTQTHNLQLLALHTVPGRLYNSASVHSRMPMSVCVYECVLQSRRVGQSLWHTFLRVHSDILNSLVAQFHRICLH